MANIFLLERYFIDCIMLAKNEYLKIHSDNIISKILIGTVYLSILKSRRMHCIWVLDAFNKPLFRSNIPFPRIPHNTRLSQNCVTTHNFKPRRLPVSLNGWVSLPPVTITPTSTLQPCTSLRIRRVWEEFDPEVAKHSRHYGGGGWRRGREDTRVTGMCREGERAPVSQEEEEAGWTRTLLSTKYCHDTISVVLFL